MMTDTPPVFTSRAPLPAVAEPRQPLDVELQRAKALALAGDLLPRSYRDRPGALLLIDQWAKARSIDVLTAIQTVSFIDGKPVVDATMQRALAERAGYSVRIVAATKDAATVAVWRDGREIGTTTYTWADATAAELTGKANWKKNPVDMLVARATTRALKWHAPSVLLGTFTEDEISEQQAAPSIVTATLPDPPSTSAVSSEPHGIPNGHAAEVIEDAEIVEPEPQRRISQQDLMAAVRRAGKRLPDLMAHAGVSTIAECVADQEQAAELLAWAEGRG